MGTFQERIRELEQRVGRGTLEGKVEVDQPYAAPIHEGAWVNFMGRYGPKDLTVHSGQTHFLSEPLLTNQERYMRRLAYEALQPKGLELAMIDNVEDLSAEVRDRAPKRAGRLSNSAHPTVTDDGSLVYDRPPVAPRESGRVRIRSHFGPSGRMHR